MEIPKGDIWIFGYGSLMWRPDFPHTDTQPALLKGYHRALCLYSFKHRGTPEVPGLVQLPGIGDAVRVGIRSAAQGRGAGKGRAAVQAHPPDIRRRWTGRPIKEVTWEQLAERAPLMVATMRRYLEQCLLSLRPSSVACFDTPFRQFATMLTTADPPVVRVADITREHIEAYKRDLATRAGHRGKPSQG